MSLSLKYLKNRWVKGWNPEYSSAHHEINEELWYDISTKTRRKPLATHLGHGLNGQTKKQKHLSFHIKNTPRKFNWNLTGQTINIQNIKIAYLKIKRPILDLIYGQSGERMGQKVNKLIKTLFSFHEHLRKVSKSW